MALPTTLLTLLPLLLTTRLALANAPFDPYIVCTGSPRDAYYNQRPIYWPPGYNASLYPTFIDLCSSAFGAASVIPNTFNVTSNNAGCACSGPEGSLVCTDENAAQPIAADPNYGFMTGHCTQQCRCTTQAKADGYRVHGQLANGQYYLTSSQGDDVIPWGSSDGRNWKDNSNKTSLSATDLVEALEENPDRFCGFEKCASNSDCINYGVCGDCTITSHIPAYPGQPYLENQSYLWAVCQLPPKIGGPARQPGNFGGRRKDRRAITNVAGNVTLSTLQSPLAFEYGCACNATFVRPECCGIADGMLPANGLQSFGSIAPSGLGEEFTPAVSTS